MIQRGLIIQILQLPTAISKRGVNDRNQIGGIDITLNKNGHAHLDDLKELKLHLKTNSIAPQVERLQELLG